MPGFFDYEMLVNALLEDKEDFAILRLKELIDWDFFRTKLTEILPRVEARGPGGAPSFDPLLMFKILVLQRYYNISDASAEKELKNQLAFRVFLGLLPGDKVPDKNTIWVFRERLGSEGIKSLFDHFNAFLDELNIIAKEGSLVDASFVEVPKQRNSREENATVKKGDVPEEWKDKPAKLRQKDTEARWTKKGGQSYYGYKNHIKADLQSKLIQNYVVGVASEHDSQVLEALVSKNDKSIYADSAYRSDGIEKALKALGITSQIHEKGVRSHPLTKEQQKRNQEKSRIRCRVEHIFGFMSNSMNDGISRYIGKKRTEAAVGMKNLVYNLFRYEQIVRLKLLEKRPIGRVA